jgi:hypothetical protein
MNRIQLAAAILLFVACNTTTDKSETPQHWFENDTLIIWNCDASKETKERIFTPADSVNIIQPFINGINKTWPEVQLKLSFIRNDTAFVNIQNTEWLNNKSGSTGAEQYLSFAVLNLLETKGIRFIRFSIPAGTHAGPDTWSSADFADWKQLNAETK